MPTHAKVTRTTAAAEMHSATVADFKTLFEKGCIRNPAENEQGAADRSVCTIG
jgi:hypothetical protein